MIVRHQWRHDSAVNWATKNPILRAGEPGVEEDTGKFKIGDGMSGWIFLGYYVDAEGVQQLIDATVDGLVIDAGGVTMSMVDAAIATAIAGIEFPESVTHDEMAAAISTAINSIVLPPAGVTEEEMELAIANAINSIDLSIYMTSSDVESIANTVATDVFSNNIADYVTTADLATALAGLSATYATDAELTAAISGLNLSSYATDAEMASAISGLGATYATDSELASAIAALNLSSYSTDAERDAAIATAISGLNATYATDSELASAISPLLKKNLNGTVSIPTTDLIALFQRQGDTSDQGTWSDMLRFGWITSGGVAKVTSYFNEFGEFRVAPAQDASVPFRIFSKVAPGGAAHTGFLFEIQDNRTDRNTLMGINSDGSITAPNIGAKVITLNASDSVPGGTAAGTVVVKKRA